MIKKYTVGIERYHNITQNGTYVTLPDVLEQIEFMERHARTQGEKELLEQLKKRIGV